MLEWHGCRGPSPDIYDSMDLYGFSEGLDLGYHYSMGGGYEANILSSAISQIFQYCQNTH